VILVLSPMRRHGLTHLKREVYIEVNRPGRVGKLAQNYWLISGYQEPQSAFSFHICRPHRGIWAIFQHFCRRRPSRGTSPFWWTSGRILSVPGITRGRLNLPTTARAPTNLIRSLLIRCSAALASHFNSMQSIRVAEGISTGVSM
jgi:hypothetical protein